MKLTLRDTNRRLLGTVNIPEGETHPDSFKDDTTGRQIAFQWKDALDDDGRLRKCPACNCREVFRRRDFPQRLGFSLVFVAGIASVILFANGLVLLSIFILASTFGVDAIIYLFTGECLVCYRCRSEFRRAKIDRQVHEPWDIAIGEKYRPARLSADGATEP